jgi:hypothetical protein
MFQSDSAMQVTSRKAKMRCLVFFFLFFFFFSWDSILPRLLLHFSIVTLNYFYIENLFVIFFSPVRVLLPIEGEKKRGKN